MTVSNAEKYRQVFIDSFDLEDDALQADQDLEYNSIEQWDSIGHMTMVANLEDCFNISMDTDDIIDFSSYKTGVGILEKYGVIL